MDEVVPPDGLGVVLGPARRREGQVVRALADCDHLAVGAGKDPLRAPRADVHADVPVRDDSVERPPRPERQGDVPGVVELGHGNHPAPLPLVIWIATQ